ncbi:MAG: HAD-IA family hydrolase [Clostridia bacterium]|nr:HAD-IA family hydrolase [Clostridia bacterium]
MYLFILLGANNWFISPNMLQILKIKDDNQLSSLKKAIIKAHPILDKYKYVQDETSEIACFEEFYNIALNEFNTNLSDIPKLAHKIALDITTNPLKYAFYEDSKEIIPALKKDFKIALVSDAWPSMRFIYDYNNMTKYFDIMVISSELGVLKPDASMYETALEKIHLKPEECIFLDDNINNCIGAKKLGIIPILVSRNHEDYIENCKQYKEYLVIENLKQLKDLIL